MPLLDPLTHCPHCDAELPPFTKGCPHCALPWRELLSDNQARRDGWIGALAALLWTAASFVLWLICENLDQPFDAWLLWATICGYPGILAILALLGRSRNRGYAVLHGACNAFLWMLLCLFIVSGFRGDIDPVQTAPVKKISRAGGEAFTPFRAGVAAATYSPYRKRPT